MINPGKGLFPECWSINRGLAGPGRVLEPAWPSIPDSVLGGPGVARVYPGWPGVP